MDEQKRSIGVLLFDTIATLEEFQQICHDMLKRGFELELSLQKEQEGLVSPEGCNVQVLISKV